VSDRTAPSKTLLKRAADAVANRIAAAMEGKQAEIVGSKAAG
jgi:hypothetical protein